MSSLLRQSVFLLLALPPQVDTPKPSPRAPLGRLQARPSMMLARDQQGLMKAAETQFKAKLEFEPGVTDVVPGEEFTIKVYLTNLGTEPALLTGRSIDVRLNREDLPHDAAPLALSVEPGRRVAVAEIKGSWPEGLRTWVASVSVASQHEYCVGRIVVVARR